MHDPLDFETIEKLRFVLNREIEVSLAPEGSDRRGHQQVLRKVQRRDRVGGLDAPGVHRHGDRLCRRYGVPVASRAPPMTLEEGDVAGHQAGAPDHPGSRDACGPATSTSSRSPTGSESVTGSTACSWSATTPPRRLLGAIVSRLKIMGFDRHRREAPAAGRPDQDPGRRQRHRPAGEHHTNQRMASRW